jgi:hypothetical protein
MTNSAEPIVIDPRELINTLYHRPDMFLDVIALPPEMISGIIERNQDLCREIMNIKSFVSSFCRI